MIATIRQTRVKQTFQQIQNSKTFIASYTYNAYRELACNKGNTAQTRQN